MPRAASTFPQMAFEVELQTKDYPYLNPGICSSPGDEKGGACLDLLDPFGNTLRIDERVETRIAR